MRFFAIGLVMFAAAYGLGWFGRRLLGTLVRGPVVLAWGAGLGALGVFLMGFAIDALGLFSGFLDLGEAAGGAGLGFLAFFGWNVGVLGGIVGAVVASSGSAGPPRQG